MKVRIRIDKYRKKYYKTKRLRASTKNPFKKALLPFYIFFLKICIEVHGYTKWKPRQAKQIIPGRKKKGRVIK